MFSLTVLVHYQAAKVFWVRRWCSYIQTILHLNRFTLVIRGTYCILCFTGLAALLEILISLNMLRNSTRRYLLTALPLYAKKRVLATFKSFFVKCRGLVVPHLPIQPFQATLIGIGHARSWCPNSSLLNRVFTPTQQGGDMQIEFPLSTSVNRGYQVLFMRFYAL